MKLLVIGPGCAKCRTLAQLTEQAVQYAGRVAETDEVLAAAIAIDLTHTA